MAQFTWPSLSITASNPSGGASGGPAPIQTTQVGGVGPDGNLHTLSTDNSGNQNVNVLASALPTGASTAAKQDTGNTTLSSIDTKTPALVGGAVPVVGPLTDTQLRATAVPVSVSNFPASTQVSNFPATQAVSAASLPLPTGAATAAKQPALGVAGTPSADVLSVQGVTGMTPFKVDGSATTQPVSLASVPTHPVTQSGVFTVQPGNTANTTAWLVAQKGRTQANAPVYNAYGTTIVTTAAYVQLIASTTAATTFVDIFDSSGQAMILATGAAASEVILAYIPPGGLSTALTIPAGTRVAVKALTSTASSGYLLANFWG